MSFEIDQKMRRFVNNNRLIFIDSLPTQLIMEGFQPLLQGQREKIRCALNNSGSTDANSLLIDAIVKVEDFSQKLIKFLEERQLCKRLVGLMGKELSKIDKDYKKSKSGTENNCEASLSQTLPRQAMPHNEEGLNNLSRRNIGSSPSGQPNNVKSSETSSFYLDSSDLEDALAEGRPRGTSDEHEIQELKVKNVSGMKQAYLQQVHLQAAFPERPEHQPVTTRGDPNLLPPNIPPEQDTNVQLLPTSAISPSKHAGTQCEEDLKKLSKNGLKTWGAGDTSTDDGEDKGNEFDGLQSNSILRRHEETVPKSLHHGDDASASTEKPSGGKVTYFELTPCKMLGMSSEPHNSKEETVGRASACSQEDSESKHSELAAPSSGTTVCHQRPEELLEDITQEASMEAADSGLSVAGQDGEENKSEANQAPDVQVSNSEETSVDWRRTSSISSGSSFSDSSCNSLEEQGQEGPGEVEPELSDAIGDAPVAQGDAATAGNIGNAGAVMLSDCLSI